MTLAILADIGGTNTRVALAEGGHVRAETIRRFPNAEYKARGQDIGQILCCGGGPGAGWRGHDDQSGLAHGCGQSDGGHRGHGLRSPQ
ncbi:MAG: hypothetical protein MUF74_11060 [Cypionkella sp.]|nr:hypothetical protein [Cypionkella sp.]